MRLHPTIADTAAFFEVSEDTIERTIKKEWAMSFAEFREQNAVHTRLNIIRKIVQKAEQGDNAMLIWYSKNKLGWADKIEQKQEVNQKVDVEYKTAWGGVSAEDNPEETDSVSTAPETTRVSQ